MHVCMHACMMHACNGRYGIVWNGMILYELIWYCMAAYINVYSIVYHGMGWVCYLKAIPHTHTP